MSKKRKQKKKEPLTKSIQATLVTRSLDDNLNRLKETVSGLTFHHAKALSDRLIDGFSSTIGRVNARVVHWNDWARAKLNEHLRTQSERKELELQIGAMEGEGNLPGIAVP